MRIYHQAGHNTNWNLESFIDDDSGDGIIFSPVHYRKSQLESVDSILFETLIKKVEGVFLGSEYPAPKYRNYI